MNPKESAPPHQASKPAHASLPQVIGAVFWSFLGVRKGHAMQRDGVTVKPLQVIIVGVVFAALLVLGLLSLVRVIIGQAH